MASEAAVQKKKEAEWEWWSREETAKFLGVSERTLRKLAQLGRIRRQHVPPGPNNPYQSMVYLAADAIAYKARASEGPTGVVAIGAPHAPAALQALALQRSLAPPPRVRRWLTLEEAVEYSGLPRAYLIRMARHPEGDISLNVGTAERPRWRFDRDHL